MGTDATRSTTNASVRLSAGVGDEHFLRCHWRNGRAGDDSGLWSESDREQHRAREVEAGAATP